MLSIVANTDVVGVVLPEFELKVLTGGKSGIVEPVVREIGAMLLASDVKFCFKPERDRDVGQYRMIRINIPDRQDIRDKIAKMSWRIKSIERPPRWEI